MPNLYAFSVKGANPAYFHAIHLNLFVLPALCLYSAMTKAWTGQRGKRKNATDTWIYLTLQSPYCMSRGKKLHSLSMSLWRMTTLYRRTWLTRNWNRYVKRQMYLTFPHTKSVSGRSQPCITRIFPYMSLVHRRTFRSLHHEPLQAPCKSTYEHRAG